MLASPQRWAKPEGCYARILSKIHRPAVHADREMHEVMDLEDDAGIDAGNVQELGLGSHPNAGEELEHWVGGLKKIARIKTSHGCDQMGRFITLWATFQSMWQQLFCPNCLHIFGNFCKFVKIFHSTSKILFGRLLWTFGNFSQVTLMGRYIWSRICLERLPGASVTRYWNIKKPDCFRKLSKSIFLNEPKNLNSFWATFLRKFVTQNFQKSPNLVTLSSKN